MIRALNGATINNALKADNNPYLIPRGDYKRASVSPLFRKKIRDLSICEDEENSYYSGILNILSEHCVGSIPLVLGNHQEDMVNDKVEDAWTDWAIRNSIGSVIRQVRRGAARTGIGIAIPYNKPSDPLGLGFKSICATRLVTPMGARVGDRIYDGIQYDENWDMIKIFIEGDDPFLPDEYAVPDEAIVWFKHTSEGMINGLPECGPAFCLFPSVRRFMDAIVKGEEFRASIPMAVTLNPDIYRPEDAEIAGVPAGSFEYEPGMVPTLPPGTELTGLNIPMQSDERTQFIKLIIGAAARCVQMPMNIALGDSSGHNMATAAYDVQPWENKVKIDRIDFEPVVRNIIKMWFDRAILADRVIPYQARNNFTYELYYDSTFQHPDPGKRANARAVDLISGAGTMHEIYTEKGVNPRRALDREARTLGITREKLNEIMVSTRTKYFSEIMGMNNENQQQ